MIETHIYGYNHLIQLLNTFCLSSKVTNKNKLLLSNLEIEHNLRMNYSISDRPRTRNQEVMGSKHNRDGILRLLKHCLI